MSCNRAPQCERRSVGSVKELLKYWDILKHMSTTMVFSRSVGGPRQLRVVVHYANASESCCRSQLKSPRLPASGDNEADEK